jgi:hypothetical protein
MNSVEHFSINAFTETTKKVCSCSAISIFLIVLFIISPLNKYFFTSLMMKLVILMILIYTVYLNNKQTNLLTNANNLTSSKNIKSQLSVNIICSYIFTLFIGLLIIFVIKSFF